MTTPTITTPPARIVTHERDFINVHGPFVYRDEDGKLKARDGAWCHVDCLGGIVYRTAPLDPRQRARAAYHFDAYFYERTRAALEAVVMRKALVVRKSLCRVSGQVVWDPALFGPEPAQIQPGGVIPHDAARQRLTELYRQRKDALTESTAELQRVAPDLAAHVQGQLGDMHLDV